MVHQSFYKVSPQGLLYSVHIFLWNSVINQQCLPRSSWSCVQLRIQKEFDPIVFWCISEWTFPCCTNKEWELGQFIQCRVLPHSSKTTSELFWHNGLNSFLKENSCFLNFRWYQKFEPFKMKKNLVKTQWC